MTTLTIRAAAAVLAVATTFSIVAGIEALARAETSLAVVTLPRVVVVAERAGAPVAERTVR